MSKTHITIHSPGKDYDPALHVTLDELRELGLTSLPAEKDVPGCAWIPRGAMLPDPSSIEATNDPDAPNKMRVRMKVGFAQALTWETVKLEIDGDVDLDELKKTLDAGDDA